jgi:hypothetical protein
MVAFLPFDITVHLSLFVANFIHFRSLTLRASLVQDNDSIEMALSHIDNAIQYGEDLEVKPIFNPCEPSFLSTHAMIPTHRSRYEHASCDIELNHILLLCACFRLLL